MEVTKEYTEYHKKDLILVDNCSACKKEYYPSDNPHNYDQLFCPKCNLNLSQARFKALEKNKHGGNN